MTEDKLAIDTLQFVGTLHHARLLETKWRAQKLLYREVDKLHDFSIRPQIMLFFCFSWRRSWFHVTSHLWAYLSPSLFMPYGYAYLCILSGRYHWFNKITLIVYFSNVWTVPGSGGVVRRRMDCIPYNYNSSSQHMAECTTKPEFDFFAVSIPPIRLDRAVLRLEYAVFLWEVA